MDRFTEVELFVRTAELGSLTRAADALGLSVSAASRHLLALESRMGARLVHRTTRRLHLTEAGAEFYRRAKSILEDLREAEAAAAESTANPTGLLRVTASLSFSVQHIAPLLPEFTRKYPNVTIEIVAANRYTDIIDAGIDVAIRTREYEADSNITVRRLAQTRRVLAAAPEYLSSHGTPQTPDDLGRHDLLVYTYANRPNELRFRRGKEQRTHSIKGLIYSNDGQVLRRAAHDGLGILIQPKYIVHDDIVAGRLVPVLDDWDLPRLTINVAFQTREHLPAKVRLFVQFLVDRFRRLDLERRWTS